MRGHWAYGAALLGASGLLFAAVAQQGGGMQGNMGKAHGTMGTMQGRMGADNRGMGVMGAMMMAGLHNPFGRSAMMAFMLPAMESELGLSSSQTADLNRLKEQFNNEDQKSASRIAASQSDLDALFKSGTPKQEQVKKAVNEIAKLQAQRLLNGYEMAAKMKAMLTPDQRSRLDAMSPTDLRSAMMSHMNMSQRTRMMRFMYGPAGAGMMSAGMMSGGMMGGGMMGGGMMDHR